MAKKGAWMKCGPAYAEDTPARQAGGRTGKRQADGEGAEKHLAALESRRGI